MQQTNDPNISQLAGSQREGIPLTTAASSAGLATLLSDLPSAAVSETGSRNFCGWFGLTDDEPATALAAHGSADEWSVVLPIPAKEFGADTLACALSLTRTNRPTLAQLDAALLEMYPVGGPTANALVAAGWLLPIIDKKRGIVEVTQQPEPYK